MRSTTSSCSTRTSCSRSSCAWSLIATRRPTPSRRRSSRRSATCARSVAAASSRGSTGSASTPRWTPSALASVGPVQPYPELEDEAWQPPAGAEADPERTALDTERTRALSDALRPDHDRPARGDRPLRRRGLRLRRDRRDDRCLARHGEVADPPRPAGAAGAPRGPDGAVPWLTHGELDRGCCVADHDLYDLEVVASLLDGDLTGSERAAAVAGPECADCATPRRILRALASATVALPTPARARDFRLTGADAAALRDPVNALGGASWNRCGGTV